MYNDKMRKIIEKAMDYGLKNIHTYKGYAGADLLKLTFYDSQELLEIRNFCKDRDIDTSVKLNLELELYCIFENVTPDDVYDIKD